MTGKTALGSFCAGLALLIATRSPNPTAQAAASMAGAGLLGYTVTALIIDANKQQKSRLADAEAYLEFLRQMNQERQSEQPPQACQGCCHYHGQTYGGQRLICAMHPYGVETTVCPDWQSGDTDRNIS
ncbi:MAG: hypothetical protein ACKO7W_01900 [Elainella sp.]